MRSLLRTSIDPPSPALASTQRLLSTHCGHWLLKLRRAPLRRAADVEVERLAQRGSAAGRIQVSLAERVGLEERGRRLGTA
jgi:hypothetical protein